MVCDKSGRKCPFAALAQQPLKQAVERFLEEIAVNGYSRRYLASLRQYLTAFANAHDGADLASVSTDLLGSWFRGRRETLSTAASNRGRMGAFFAWCVRRGLLHENPIDRLDRPRLIRSIPHVFTVSEVEQCLEWFYAHPMAMSWFVLGTFGGLRPEEADQTPWENIRDGIVIVDAAASKVRRRRIVDLEPKAVRLLDEARAIGARQPIPRTTRRREIRTLRAHLGWPAWKHDVTRHTAASMLLAKHKDAERVALLLGNSPSVLLTHYRELVSESDCREFWTEH